MWMTCMMHCKGQPDSQVNELSPSSGIITDLYTIAGGGVSFLIPCFMNPQWTDIDNTTENTRHLLSWSDHPRRTTSAQFTLQRKSLPRTS